jgi:EAL domain-containing protein (putative c-di-GMP-specific phosphodiesterase class I)
VAEETGLIMPIGEWVLRHACSRAMQWHREGLTRAGVAVNISARQFQRGLVELVSDVLAETGLEPSALELEITEGSAMHDVERTVRTLKDLKSLGVALAIDDFGTGFSSLSYLSRFPIDRLKIDQSFVSALGKDSSATAIASAVVTLGHSLGLRVIAEGVETQAQLNALRDLGCDEIQGYLFSKPLGYEEFIACLREGRRLMPERGAQGPFYEQPGLSTVV